MIHLSEINYLSFPPLFPLCFSYHYPYSRLHKIIQWYVFNAPLHIMSHYPLYELGWEITEHY